MASRSESSSAHSGLRPPDLHSHQFAFQRAVGALAMRDPDPPAAPTRRISGSLFASVMIAVLAVAAVGVYGLLRPDSAGAWRDGRATIIEKETGARYVLLSSTLYPVLNHTSAMLILGTDATVLVPARELRDVPRGAPVGIPGAPDPLPRPDALVAGPWTLCTEAPATGVPPPDGSILRVGWAPDAQPLGAGAVLALDPNGQFHLLWNNRRFAIRDPDLVLAAFTWPKGSATPVAAAVLNAIPAGADLAAIEVAGDGGASAVPGLQAGEVFVVENPDGGRLFGVALPDGVSDVSAVQAALLVAQGANGGDPPRRLSAAAYASARKVGSLIPTGDDAPPGDTPTQVHPGEHDAVCATFRPGETLPTLSVSAIPAPTLGAPAPRVDVPPGRGALVESLATAAAESGSICVITDLGLRFAVPSAKVLDTLGYGGVTPLRLPASLVSLVPPGPALDPAAAVLPVG